MELETAISQDEPTGQSGNDMPRSELGNDVKPTDPANVASPEGLVAPITEPITVSLSRDELKVVLRVLQAETMPGIDLEPTGSWSPQEQAIAELVATRSLRARGLAQIDGDGQLQLHTDLLAAVGVCIHAHSSLFLFHWPVENATPARCFGHVLHDSCVLHTRLDDVLHLFTLMPSKSKFLSQMMLFCGLEDDVNSTEKPHLQASRDVVGTDESDIPSEHEFRIPTELFAKVRNADAEEAITLLTDSQVTIEDATAFMADLAASPRVSIMQAIQQTDSEEAIKRDFTIIDGGQRCWLLAIEGPAEADVVPLLIKSTRQTELVDLLDAWL